MSRFRFAHVFREITGVAPRAYFQMLRGQRIRKELNRPGRVTDSIFDAGYGSSGSFYAQSNSLLGMTPGLYRRKGKGLTLRYAAGVCRFGSLLVAGSEKGICSIALGDNVESLLADLRKEFADAQIVEGDAELAAYVAQIAAYAEQPRKALHLPLDIQGTAFQRRVWELLQMVPVGETATYSQIAQRLGKPGAVRAVARACATNRIALAVPCHRIVRNDGTPSGYRWGLERKTALLAHERDH